MICLELKNNNGARAYLELKNQLRSGSKWMIRKEKTISTKYWTCLFCQKAPRPALSPAPWDHSLPWKPAGTPGEEDSPGHSPDSKSKWRRLRAKIQPFTSKDSDRCKVYSLYASLWVPDYCMAGNCRIYYNHSIILIYNGYYKYT